MKRMQKALLGFALMAVLFGVALAYVSPAVKYGWSATGGRDFQTTAGASVFTVESYGAVQGKALVQTESSASLVSPAVTFSAAGKGLIVLTANANLTGVYPTGGKKGQIITIRSGAGANTMRFDNGTSMSLGNDITLTEGENDYLTLQCTNDDGDEWAAVSAHDNAAASPTPTPTPTPEPSPTP